MFILELEIFNQVVAASIENARFFLLVVIPSMIGLIALIAYLVDKDEKKFGVNPNGNETSQSDVSTPKEPAENIH